MKRKKLRNDDYLIEISTRVAVRKEDAAAVIALRSDTALIGEDETEEAKLFSVIMDMVGEEVDKHEELIEYFGLTGHRISTVKKFRDIFQAMRSSSVRSSQNLSLTQH